MKIFKNLKPISIPNIFRVVLIVFIYVLVFGILVVSLKGEPGNPSPTDIPKLQGRSLPFELSPERGRFALIQSIAENKTVFFSADIARYVIPDLGFKDGKFVSLFAPGVSFIAMPFYYLGKTWGLSQVFTFGTVIIFAILNVGLIALLTKRMTGNGFAGLTSGLVFLFGTSAYAYATTLYQHHFTTFIILASLYLLTFDLSLITSLLFGGLCALAFFIEYPTLIFLIPAGFLFISKTVKFETKNKRVFINIKYTALGFFIGIGIFVTPTFYYNKLAYGNPFQLAGTVTALKNFTIDRNTGEILTLKSADRTDQEKSVQSFFDPSALSFGWGVILGSFERGLVFYSPVIFLSLLSLLFFKTYKNDGKMVVYTLLSTALIIIFLFGMWGDPWGGWAFGPRYLIPATAPLAVLLGLVIDKWGKKRLFAISFFSLMVYSVVVNVLGALTTNTIPPNKEHDSIVFPVFKYIFNLNMLNEGQTSSFAYKTYLHTYITATEFSLIIGILIYCLISLAYIFSIKNSKKET